MFIHFCYVILKHLIRGPSTTPHPPTPLCSLLTGLCYRRVADGNAQVGCVNMADFCMSCFIVLLLQKAHLKKKEGRLLNSERECVQGIFASTYGSLFEAGEKGSRYFFKSLCKLPPLSPTHHSHFSYRFHSHFSCLFIYCALEFVVCFRHLLFFEWECLSQLIQV